jgi:hypothetical protein
MNKHLALLLLFFWISIKLFCQINNREQQKYNSFYDLPNINWANDGLHEISFGLSKHEVAQRLGCNIRTDQHNENNSLEDGSCNLSTTWFKQRIIFGEKTYPNFKFVFDKLYSLGFVCYPGFEEGLLNSIFNEFGPARYKNGNYNGGCYFFKGDGELITKPYKSDKTSCNVYEWHDKNIDVVVCDQNNEVSVIITAWELQYETATYSEKEDIKEYAQDYLDWINWWYKNH